MKDAKYLVFGGSGGIGSALSRRLAEAGATLIIAGRNASTLSTLAAELGCDWLECDATDAAQVTETVNTAVEKMGGLQGVAHCIGSILLKPAHLTKPVELQETLNQNLVSAFNVLRAAVRPMMREGGSVVFVASSAARRGLPNHEAVAAAKAGVIGLTLSAAATYAPRKIRVNAVSPGLVDTPLAERMTSNSKSLEASAAMHALGHIGTPDDVAATIAFLLDPANSWITGQVYGVDGGLAIVG